MSAFLNHAELKILAARRERAAIIRALDRMGVKYVLDGDQWPLVAAEYLRPREQAAVEWEFDVSRVR